MGWGLFRREALKGFVILMLAVSCQSEHARARRAPAPLPPLQGHKGPQVFSLDLHLERPEVIVFIKHCLQNLRPRLSIIFDRSEIFLGHIRRILYKEGLPQELIWLPVLESSYRTDAISHQGATGLWQFTKRTAQGQGMVVHESLDERRDFWKSTKEALEKLTYNREKTGSWSLALAAYNCGLFRVLSAMKESGIDNFWELAEKKLLPKETISYVPMFYAVAYIASHRGRHGFSMEKWESFEWERVPVAKPISLRVLAEKSGISYELLQKGNAEFTHDGIQPSQHRQQTFLKVPRHGLPRVQRILGGGEKLWVEFKKYRVKKGDSLWGLSRRYGLSVAEIKRHNPESTGLLREGQLLLLPLVS